MTGQADKIPVAIVGASGYTGAELIRLLQTHPQFQVVAATSRRYAGQPVATIHSGLRSNLVFGKPDYAQIASKAQLAFVCLPHGSATSVVSQLAKTGCQVVDLSADLRYDDAALYQKTYNVEASALLPVPYGLPEWNREAIKGAQIVANPGCYVTASLLPLLPLVETGLITGTVVIDAKSGVTGAGRKAVESLLLAELAENVYAYATAGHRHESEIRHRLASIAGKEIDVLFSPHLLPVKRGILASIYLPGQVSARAIRQHWQDCYQNDAFVQILPKGSSPSLRSVVGSNRCDMQVVERPDGHSVILSALDNLTKGAAGQAIQNANLMCALPEDSGLPLQGSNL